jgi:hypothetical protein
VFAVGSELDLRRIAELVRSQGIPCQVDQTGGGCATLYAGPPDDRLWADQSDYYPVSAGPGTYYPAPTALDCELTVGLTRGGDVCDFADCEGLSEREVADLVADYYWRWRRSL